MKRFIFFVLLLVCCFSFFYNSVSADAITVSCLSSEKVNSFCTNWVGTATDWLFASNRSENESQRREEITTILSQAKQGDSPALKTTKIIRCIQQQFQIDDSDIINMYVFPEQYERIWLSCSVSTTKSIGLLGAFSQTEGMWVDRGCGRKIKAVEFGKEKLYDGEIDAGEHKTVYILLIVKKNQFGENDFNPELTLLFQDKADGTQRMCEVIFSDDNERKKATERFTITATEIERADISAALTESIIQEGIKSPEEKEYLLLHFDEFDCNVLTIFFDTDSQNKWWNPRVEVYSSSNDVYFASEYYGGSAYFSDLSQVSIYFFCPTNYHEEVVCDIWLLAEKNAYESNTSSFGYAFGPQQKFFLGQIALLP